MSNMEPEPLALKQKTDTAAVLRHRTALSRSGFSRPIRLAIEEGLISPETQVFDYGCGRGDDVRLLQNLGIRCTGWDPVYQPDVPLVPSDVVNLGYVINVIEDPEERAATLMRAWRQAGQLLIVSGRLTVDASHTRQTSYQDGYLTRRGTFQKYYEQQELREWIDSLLDTASVPAAPGVFYVFRDQNTRESFLASRCRRSATPPPERLSDVLFKRHKDLLKPLMAFLAARGRLPDDSELATAQTVRNELGSLKKAFDVIRKATGPEQWDRIHEERSQDLLVYLALAQFNGLPRFSHLPPDLQFDVRAFFSTYKDACAKSNTLLFSAGDRKAVDNACRSSKIGKITPGALYVHSDAILHLAPVLRVYEGCARAFVGAVEGANVIKLNRTKPKVSYLSYPEFERDPHPALAGSLVVDLESLQLRYWDYANSDNPPILHRKEELIPQSHPLRGKFARLTEREEKHGLYENPQSIGTRKGWETVLQEKGLRFAGHRLVKNGS